MRTTTKIFATATLLLFAMGANAQMGDAGSTSGTTSGTTTGGSTATTTGGASKSSGTMGENSGTGTMGTATEAKTTTPSDAEIAHIEVTANTIDVESGKLAQSKSDNKEVKDYAKMMVNDHSSANKEAAALAKKAGIQPKDNDTSKTLKTSAGDTMKTLKGLKGKEFDKAYLAQEVAFHQQVLDTINNTLEPSAKNQDLKNHINKIKPTIEAHLEHAKKLQEKVGQM